MPGYTFHKDILCSVSRYFENAFTGSFKETQDKTFKLQSDISADGFRLFQEWLYSRDKSFDAIDRYLENAMHEDQVMAPISGLTEQYGVAHAEFLLEMHIFAEEHDIPLLRRHTFEAFQNNLKDDMASALLITASHVALAYERLPDQSPWRRLLVNNASWSGFNERIKGVCPDPYPKQFLWDVIGQTRVEWTRRKKEGLRIVSFSETSNQPTGSADHDSD